MLTWAHLVFINEKNFPSEDAEETVVVVELVLAVVDAAVVAVVAVVDAVDAAVVDTAIVAVVVEPAVAGFPLLCTVRNGQSSFFF